MAGFSAGVFVGEGLWNLSAPFSMLFDVLSKGGWMSEL